MKRRHVLAGLGGLSVAGCLRLESGGSTTTGGTPVGTTATTATTTSPDGTTEGATEETTTAPEESSYPPGIDDEGVYAYLADTHLNHLSRTSFEERWRVRHRTDEYVEGANARVADGRALVSDVEGDVTSYQTADGIRWRSTVDGEPVYGTAEGTFDFQRVARGAELRALLLAGAWSAPVRDGDTWTVEASGTDEPTALRNRLGVSAVESFEASATVTDAGVVQRLLATVEGVDEDGGRLSTVAFDHRVLAEDTATAAEPSWYGTAVERAPRVSVSLDADASMVALEHQSGGPIATRDTFHLHEVSGEERTWHGRLSDDVGRPLEAGDTLYAWVPEDGSDLALAVGSRPVDATARTLSGDYRFLVDHEGHEYFGIERVSA